ncbi:LacI family transcriptional regulator [Opitutaceae bacterium EW11]|nr:LacI family transcriptional regulator [Opitutaceae bacterium EW11]
MTTIAERAGVSKNTVSLALRHDPQIPVGTRRRIAKIARNLGYTKNPVVSQLMTELRKAHPAGYRRTLALLNANQDPQAFTRHPTVPVYVDGCRRRATFHGYKLDEFWLHDPELSGERLERILRARGIRGVLIVGLMNENQLPERFQPLWSQLACVVTGVRTRNPTLPFCCVDHHALVMQAFEQARRLGYRRPALVVDERIDKLVDGRFSSGMWIGQLTLPPEDRLPGFFQVEASRSNPKLFTDWLTQHRPDVVFTLYHFVRPWIEQTGVRVPQDIGIVQLERRRGSDEWAGMDQHNDLTGEGAVDMLVGMLHNNEIGLPPFPRATLISGTWVGGKTVRRVEVCGADA